MAHALVPFAEEFRRAARTSAFWIAAARELVPVAGVIALGWSAFAAALFFLFESWLLMSLRASAEITLNPRYAGKDLPNSTREAVVQVLKHFAYVLPFMGLLLGFFAAFILTVAFTREDLWRFLELEWREPAVLVVAIAVVSIAIEGAPAAIVAWIETGKGAAADERDVPPD